MKMNKRRNDKLKAHIQLHKNGVPVQKHDQIRPNAGSETFAHELAKLCVGFIGKANDYWVASEVECDNGKEIDVVLWGNPDRLTYAVECETGWTEETKTQKVNQYVKPYSEIDDMLTVEVNELPANYMDALGFVSDDLGLDV